MSKATNIEDIYSLSPLQEGMLFHTLYRPEERAYLDHILCRLSAPDGVDAGALERAFQRVVDRHAALRTAFVWKLRDKPQQVVLRRVRVPVETLDWRALSPAERELRLAERLEQDRERGYDLARPPLMRLTLMRLDEESHYFLFSYHHIIMDAWSVPVVFGEMLALYAAFARGEDMELPRPRPFRAYIDWLRQRDLSLAEAFWGRELAGFATPTPLAQDRPPGLAGAEDGSYEGVQTELTAACTAGLQSLAREQRLTVNNIVQGAWAVLLSRLSGEEDVVFGSVVAGRPHDLPGVESMVGLFTNTLPVRVRLRPEDRLGPWLKELQSRQFAARELEWSPLVKVQECSDVPRGVSLFDSIVIFQNTPAEAVLGNRGERGLEIRISQHDPKNNFPVTLMIAPGPRLWCRLLYDGRSFDRATMERRLESLRVVLEGMVAAPENRVSDLPVLSEEELYQVLVGWNDSSAEFPLGSCFHEIFALQASLAPEAVAAVCDGEQLTYRQLDRRSSGLALQLAAEGVGPGGIVALLADRGLGFLTAVLAVLKTGAAYLPLDPGHPEQRLAQVLELSEAATALASEAYLPGLRGAVGRLGARRPALLSLEELLERLGPDRYQPSPAAPTSLAYVIYTSGSTGVPKGAMVEHRGMLNHLYAKVRDLGLGAADRVAQNASQCFDISVWQLLAPLLVGGRVHIFDDDVAQDPVRLLRSAEGAGITVLEVVPSMLRMMLEEIGEPDGFRPSFGALSGLIATGEALPPELARRWLAEYPGVPLWNAYGPTECSDDVTHHRMGLPPAQGVLRVPVGRPVANMRLYVLDRGFRLVPVGGAGELCAGGVGVGRGYLKDPGRTAAVFVPDPFSPEPGGRLYRTGDLARRQPDGTLDFLGRIDHQVKIRGFRIELREIEALIERHPAVRTAAVLALAGEGGTSDRLVAYVVPDTPEPREAELASAEAERVAQWQTVFDEVYRQRSVSERDSAVHLRVWVDSYTGRPFPEEEIFESVEDSVARVLALRPRRVLEIGCGSGLLLSRIAPRCESYCGTDISEVALRALERRVAEERPASAVTLLQRPADDFTGIARGEADAVVVNEVVQYFPDVEYLLRVVDGAIGTVRTGGYVFLGGLRSFPLLEAFHASVQLFQAAPSMPLEELRRQVRAHAAQDKELAVSPDFFLALQESDPRVTRVWLRPKGGRARNEFTRFRYDAVLEIGGPSRRGAVPWQEWQPGWDLGALRRRLSEEGPEQLALATIPNSRARREARTVTLLQQPGELRTAGELREALEREAPEAGGIDPQDLEALARELGYEIEVSWAGTDATGRYDAVLRRPGADPGRTVQLLPGRPLAAQPWSRYANAPRQVRSSAELAQELKQHLRSHLPEYMVPSAFVVLDEMPLTANGKIDRRALPAHEQAAAPQAAAAGARTPTEELLASLWSEILGVQEIGPDDDFFEAGGHSLLGTQVLSRLRKTFQIELPLRALFEASTLSSLARRIDEAVRERDGGAAPPIERRPRKGPLPLSFAQQRLWVVDQMEPGPTYNIPMAVRVDGALDLRALAAALGEILRRHEVLRTSFEAAGGEPVAVAHPPTPVDLPVIDLRLLPEPVRDGELRRLAIEEAHQVFDLLRGPLLRIRVLRLADEAVAVLLTLHHIVSDAWSMGVLVRELATLYGAFVAGRPAALPEMAIQYADFAAWQRQWLQGEVLERQLSYWKRRLAPPLPTLELPLDRPRPAVPSSRGRDHHSLLPQALTRTLKDLGRQEGATFFMTLLAALKTLFYRSTGQKDLVVGTDIANRNRAETEDLIGFFVNLLVLRTDLSGSPTFREALRRVRDVALEAYAHQDLSFDLLTRELRPDRGFSQAPLFDFLFVFQNAPVGSIALPDARLSPLPFDYQTARFDLALFVEETAQGLAERWTYRTDLFDPATVERLSGRYRTLLEKIAERPDDRLDDLDLTSEAERQEWTRLQERSRHRFKQLRPRMVDVAAQAEVLE